MKLFAAALLFSAAAATSFAGVDPALLGLVMPDAQVLTGIQVDQAQASALGQYVLSQFQPPPNLQKLMDATGFDPRHDLEQLLAANSGGQNGLILGRGNFQPAKIAGLAIMGGAKSSDYKGIQLLTNAKGANPSSVAFPDATLVIAGPTPLVTAAIDRYLAHQTSSGPLEQQAVAISASEDAWFVAPSAGFLTDRIPSGGNNQVAANLLQSVVQTSGGVKFGTAAVTLSAQALMRSAQDAQSLVDVLKFVVGMVQSNASQNPHAAGLAAIAGSATFATNGPSATVTVSVPEQQIEQFLQQQQQPRARARKVAARR